MSETPLNQDIEQVIRASLAATKSWGWSDDDRKWSAAGAALKYLESNSTMSDALANGIALKITEEIMREEEPAMRYCVHCGGHHNVADLERGWHCPLDPAYPFE